MQQGGFADIAIDAIVVAFAGVDAVGGSVASFAAGGLGVVAAVGKGWVECLDSAPEPVPVLALVPVACAAVAVADAVAEAELELDLDVA